MNKNNKFIIEKEKTFKDASYRLAKLGDYEEALKTAELINNEKRKSEALINIIYAVTNNKNYNLDYTINILNKIPIEKEKNIANMEIFFCLVEYNRYEEAENYLKTIGENWRKALAVLYLGNKLIKSDYNKGKEYIINAKKLILGLENDNIRKQILTKKLNESVENIKDIDKRNNIKNELEKIKTQNLSLAYKRIETKTFIEKGTVSLTATDPTKKTIIKEKLVSPYYMTLRLSDRPDIKYNFIISVEGTNFEGKNIIVVNGKDENGNDIILAKDGDTIINPLSIPIKKSIDFSKGIQIYIEKKEEEK
ncbi:MAG: hypothetical protein ACOCUI_00460 [bacterium]